MQKFSLKEHPEFKFAFKVFIVIGILFIFYLFANYFYVRNSSINEVKSFLKENSLKIIEDLKYENGQWDTSIYVADPEIAIDNPVYIFTAEGFLIDRINPITGFLDTSDFEYALSFESPQTFTSPIDELWRIYSKPIERNGEIQGAILVAFFEPKLSALKEVDEEILESTRKIDSKIEFKDGKLDLAKLEEKEISFNVSFEVVDKFNKAIKSLGGGPAYIDRSFVQSALKTPEVQIKDERTGEPFIVLTRPILGPNNSLIGVISVGRSLQPINDVLRNQILFSAISGNIILFFMILFSLYLYGREIPAILKQRLNELREPKPLSFETISFNVAESCIQLDDEKVEIPSDTNQYYLCKALFSSPKKKWEHDELLEKFGEGFGEGNWRKVYDSAMVINRKVREKIGIDLIVYKSKVYKINPEIVPKIA